MARMRTRIQPSSVWWIRNTCSKSRPSSRALSQCSCTSCLSSGCIRESQLCPISSRSLRPDNRHATDDTTSMYPSGRARKNPLPSQSMMHSSISEVITCLTSIFVIVSRTWFMSFCKAFSPMAIWLHFEDRDLYELRNGLHTHFLTATRPAAIPPMTEKAFITISSASVFMGFKTTIDELRCKKIWTIDRYVLFFVPLGHSDTLTEPPRFP